VIALLVVAGGNGGASDLIDVGPERRAITTGRIEEHLGRVSLAGQAHLKDVQSEDGVMKCDIAVNGERSFPGIIGLNDSVVARLEPGRTRSSS
jgi:hypothetical protein